MLPACLLAGLLVSGELLWRWRTRRVGIVLLMAAAMLCPLAVATGLSHLNWLDGGSRSQDLLPRILTNHQLLAAAIVGSCWPPAFGGELHLAFAIIWGLSFIVVATAVFGLEGLRAHLEAGKSTRLRAGIGPGLGLLALGMAWDIRWKVQPYAAPLYLMAVALLLAGLTLIPRFGPTLQWLGVVHGDRAAEVGRQIKYSFMINGVAYLLLGLLAIDPSAAAGCGESARSCCGWPPAHPDTYPGTGKRMAHPGIDLDGAGDTPSDWCAGLRLPQRSQADEIILLLRPVLRSHCRTVPHRTTFRERAGMACGLGPHRIAVVLLAWRYPLLFDKTKRKGDRGQR